MNGGGKDELIMRVLELDVFKSAEGIGLDPSSISEGDLTIVKSCPPITDEEESGEIK